MTRPPAGDDLTRLLRRQDGVISRRQALAWLSPGAVRRRLVEGRWRLVHRSVYVAGPVARLTEPQRWWVALHAAGRQAVLGGLSALAVHGLRGFASARVHVLIPGAARDRDPPAFVDVHRTTVLPVSEVHADRPPRTTVGRSVIDAAQWAPDDAVAAGIVAACVQQGLAPLPVIVAAYERQARARRRALVLAVARQAAVREAAAWGPAGRRDPGHPEGPRRRIA